MAPSNTPRKPRPLPQPKAGEAIAGYGGLPSGACAARLQMTARERALVDRALALVGRQLRVSWAAFDSPHGAKEYFRLAIGAEPVEHFCALFLDSQHRGIAFERLAQGTLTQTLKSALALVDVRVLDHIIVTPGAALSMAEMGLV